MRAPTLRQLEVLRTIEALRASKGFTPSIRDLGAALQIRSTNAIADHLRLLAQKDLIDWSPHTARSIRLTSAGRRTLGIKCHCRCHEGVS